MDIGTLVTQDYHEHKGGGQYRHTDVPKFSKFPTSKVCPDVYFMAHPYKKVLLR